MTKRDKLLQKLFQNPGSLRYTQIETLLLAEGCVKVQTKGSHFHFVHGDMPYDLTIPVHNRDCKDVYKIEAMKFLKKLTS